MNDHLRKYIEKYNHPVPRYTSYPTVPHWQLDFPEQQEWIVHLQTGFDTNKNYSLYIHLPFCEQLCTYCGCNKRITRNHDVEERYIRSVLAEWKIYRDLLPGGAVLEELHLGGGTPTFFSPANLEHLISSLTADVKLAKNHSFSFEAHPNSASFTHLKVLRQLGFNRVSIGVQDVSERILKAINRHQDKEQVIQVTENARMLNYESVNYDLIYGLPFQHEKDIDMTMDFVKDHSPDRIAFYSYAHVPWKSKGQRAFTLDNIKDGWEKYLLKRKGLTSLKSMGYREIGMDHFARPEDPLSLAESQGELHRSFMGYTEKKPNILIGLGCSSISETAAMYVQNTKPVEAYEKDVGKGQLSLFKGHVLNEKETHIKYHLTHLLCNSFTDFDIDHPNVLRTEHPGLKEFQDLGWLQMDSTRITVSNDGREFIRIISAYLDPMYVDEFTEERYSLSV